MNPQRLQNLTTTRVADELLVYNARTAKAYLLDRMTTTVLMKCDGARSVAHLGKTLEAEFDVQDGTVLAAEAVRQLVSHELVEAGPEGGHRGKTRRELLAAAGKLAVLPGVTSVLVPTPAAAVSCVVVNGWDKTSIEVRNGVCMGGQVSWDICNDNEDQPQCGDTSCNTYQIYRDPQGADNGILLLSDSYPALGAAGSASACHTVTYGPTVPGTTYRLVAQRACNHPGGGPPPRVDVSCPS